MEENIKDTPLNMGMKPVKIKGHTTITLTDVNTGEVRLRRIKQ